MSINGPDLQEPPGGYQNYGGLDDMDAGARDSIVREFSPLLESIFIKYADAQTPPDLMARVSDGMSEGWSSYAMENAAGFRQDVGEEHRQEAYYAFNGAVAQGFAYAKLSYLQEGSTEAAAAIDKIIAKASWEHGREKGVEYDGAKTELEQNKENPLIAGMLGRRVENLHFEQNEGAILAIYQQLEGVGEIDDEYIQDYFDDESLKLSDLDPGQLRELAEGITDDYEQSGANLDAINKVMATTNNAEYIAELQNNPDSAEQLAAVKGYIAYVQEHAGEDIKQALPQVPEQNMSVEQSAPVVQQDQGFSAPSI